MSTVTAVSPPMPAPIFRPPTSQVAILAFVAALMSFAGAAYAGPLTAIVCGRMALRQIQQAPITGRVPIRGNRLARAAIVLGYVGLAVHLLATIIALTFAVLVANGTISRMVF
ncbi:DUF4190 domain-containing protein [Cryptosporangium aurantiacum]|uniref:DUF4190 domain-containing protein n=1 Tax=Cryptosporangium aurantiacum TaxID=134849 RepID=A0A1M7RJM5_9ACTN|nr:DUF4190 domain-containing protein [Cryptosporangium aurantiacum]SHN46351.1 protein of unknown function [Cryptosporangium aurantiacum]